MNKMMYHILCQCVEEILGYLKSCFSREPTMATVCVQQVSNLLCTSLIVDLVFCIVTFIVCVCGSLYGSSTERCAATGATPRRVRLVPADRACKGVGFPVRWYHTSLYAHTPVPFETQHIPQLLEKHDEEGWCNALHFITVNIVCTEFIS